MRLRCKLDVVEVGSARLREGGVALDLPRHLAPDVEIPGAGEAWNEGCGVATGGGDHAGGAGCRSAVRPRPAVAGRYGRQQGRLRLADQRPRLQVGGGLPRDGLVGNFDLSEKKSEFRVVIERPPVAAIELIARRRDLPALKLLEGVRDGRRLGHIIGTDRTSGQCNHQRQRKYQCGRPRRNAPTRSASGPIASTATNMGQRNHSRKPVAIMRPKFE